MNSRERMLRTLKFQTVDRVPLIEWPIRQATMREWQNQGYPEGVSYRDFFDLDTAYMDIPIHMGIYPAFEERILEQNGKYKIWQDNLGAIRKDFSRDDNPGFVTRTWLNFPVHDRESFLEIKKRYDSCDPNRYPDNWRLRFAVLNDLSVATHLSIPFLFWTVRDWMGFENTCLAFYDMPNLIEEMFTFLTDFCIETIKRGIHNLNIDIVELKEDMAYKHAPMISPDLFRRFMLPQYRRLITFLKSNKVQFVYVDCDGYPGDLIPLWLEAGVDGLSPCEIAAGNNMIELRRSYPGLALFGGIDKRELAKDKQAIDHEVMSKVPWMIKKGGFIPHVDHAIPFDVPLANYLYYRKILTEIVYG